MNAKYYQAESRQQKNIQGDWSDAFVRGCWTKAIAAAV